MPSSDIEDVAFAGNKLFLATLKGLALVDQENPRTNPIIYGLDEGLPSEKVEALAMDPSEKILFVATRYGLAAFEKQN